MRLKAKAYNVSGDRGVMVFRPGRYALVIESLRPEELAAAISKIYFGVSLTRGWPTPRDERRTLRASHASAARFPTLLYPTGSRGIFLLPLKNGTGIEIGTPNPGALAESIQTWRDIALGSAPDLARRSR